ncbi:hypothetical protein [Moheibacter sp.]|uniref:hypothetical protein n=1 Tax=Moheibacter sp. TaxID=1965316 RepID=UPI003C7557CC
MTYRIAFIISIILIESCSTKKVVISDQRNDFRNIYFSKAEVDYSSLALNHTILTRGSDILDIKNEIDGKTLEKLRKLNIYENNTMNFVNAYNDSLQVVFSFPKRDCLSDELSSYLWNFSTSKQYIIISAKDDYKIDSMVISHETRIVPPVDCAADL